MAAASSAVPGSRPTRGRLLRLPSPRLLATCSAGAALRNTARVAASASAGPRS